MRSLLTLLLIACPALADAAWYSDTQPIMGTRVHAELWSDDETEALHLLAQVMARMRAIEARFSPYRPDSELSMVNRNAARGPVVVSPELFTVIERSLRVSELSGGAFDITYASIGRRYDYRNGRRPTDAEIADGLAAVNYRHVVLDPDRSTVQFAHPDVYLDLGGIAKGYAVDVCIEALAEAGVSHALVAAGGDSRIMGDRRGRPWTIGVKDPRRPDAMAAVLPLVDTAVSTSGDYERFFEQDGVRYHHILDPATGDSARGVRSVTILGPEATFTDALSTSVFVLGADRGLALVNRLDGVDAVIVDAQGRLRYSRDLEPLAAEGQSTASHARR